MEEENHGVERQAELQKKIEQMRAAQQQEAQVRQALRMFLDDAAYERLVNIKMSNPALFSKVAGYIFSLAQSNKLKGKMTEEQLKMLVNAMLAQKREGTITRISK